MLILGLILFGMLVGAAAQMILGRDGRGIDWGMALVAGLAGSFVGGLILSLLFGDGLDFRPSGIIGSILGAIIVTYLWRRFGASRGRDASDRSSATLTSDRLHSIVAVVEFDPSRRDLAVWTMSRTPAPSTMTFTVIWTIAATRAVSLRGAMSP